MKFNLQGLKNPGDVEKERVVIEILEDGNVGQLLVASTIQADDNSVSPRISNPYWIPDQDVKKGDLVIVYTKSGQKSNRKNETDSYSYFFYIGMDSSIYDESNKTTVVFDISNWLFVHRDQEEPQP